MMSLFVIGPLLAIFIILIPFIKSITSFNRFVRGEHQPTRRQVSPTNYDFILDVDDYEEAKPETVSISSWEFAEFLFVGVAPLLGVGLIYIFYSEIKPFHIEYVPIVGAYVFIGFLSYWFSRFFKEQLPIFIVALLPYGIGIGILLYIILIIHFISPMTLLGGALLPFLGFPLFAPLPALLYSIREMRILIPHLHNRIYISENSIDYTETGIQFASNISWHNSLQNWALLGVFILGVQAIFYSFGFPLESIWLALREGEGFFFSKTNFLF